MGAYLSEPITTKESEDGEGNGLKFGASSMQGWRVSQEDAHNCIGDFDTNTSLFGVYDGHGGAEIATYLARHFPDFLKRTDDYKSGNDVKKALHNAFVKIDESIKTKDVQVEVQAIAKGKNNNEEVSVGYDYEEENVCALYEEATMPLEALVAKYHTEQKCNPEIEPDEKPCSSKSLISPKRAMSADHIPSPTNITDNPEVPINVNEISLPSLEVNKEKSPNIDRISTATPNNEEKHFVERISGSESNGENTHNYIQINQSSLIKETTSVLLKNPGILENGVHDGSEEEITLEKENKSHEPCNKITQSPHVNGDKEKCDKVCIIDKSSENAANSSSSPEKATSSSSTCTSAGGTPSIKRVSIASVYQSLVNPPDSDSEMSDSDSDTDSFLALKNQFENDDSSASDEINNSDTSEEDIDEMCEEEEQSDEGEEDEFLNDVQEPGFDSGSTAVVALLKWEAESLHLWVANAGDSRCVISRNGKALDMSKDHKPEDEVEATRIISAGGKVTVDGRVNGGLNLSRALGDHSYKQNDRLTLEQQMITPVPDVEYIALDNTSDEFIILACDGIWNSMSSQEVVDFISKRLSIETKLSSICEQLFDACLARDTSGDGTGCDNMTAVIIRIPKPKNGKRDLGFSEAESEPKRVKLEEDDQL